MTAFLDEFRADVICGLGRNGQKQLPAKYFYDEVGSALFETITVLPEYGLTRADARLLERYAPEIVGRVGRDVTVAELGSGTGKKTRWILQALPSPAYYPIDLSGSALRLCETQLDEFADVRAVPASYLDGLRQVVSSRSVEPLLVLFLGSTIGNFDRRCGHEFLSAVRSQLREGDFVLLGTDLVKDREVMLEAYDDPAGVTAAFNLNLLARMNRELGADFRVRCFSHEALYNDAEQRIEMHLRSRADQVIRMDEFSCRMAAGETIWTESSHKYRVAEFPAMAEAAGFRHEMAWVDDEWPFSENLWIAT